MAILAWNVPLVSLIFLKRSLVFPILLFSCISLHWSLRKAFLSLLAVLWNSAFRWISLSSSPLPFASLLFSAICKASSDSHFAFLHFLFLGMVLITASCTVLQTSIHSSSGTHQIPGMVEPGGLPSMGSHRVGHNWSDLAAAAASDLIPWIYFSLPLFNHKGFDWSHTWMA